MKKLFAMLLVLCMMVSLMTACGHTSAPAASAGSEAATDSAAAAEPADEAPAAEPDAAAAPASDEASAAEEAEAEPTEGYVSPYTVTYPIPGDDNRLSMIQCLRNNAVAMISKDFTEQYVYPYLAEATGVEIDFIMIAEAALTEQLNLRISSQDYPDIFGQGIGTYDSNAIQAIEDGVVLDLSDLLEENAPEYYTILQNIPDFAESIYNSDGSICKITSCNIGIQSQGMYIRGDWLDALNMEVPTTIDELTEVLRLFHSDYGTTMSILVNCDLDDGLAVTFDHSNVGFSRQMIGFQLKEPGSDEVVCAMASDGYFEHMTYLRQLYAESLITSDFLSISKENGNFESSYYTGVCGVWQDGGEVADPSYAENAEDPNWQAIPMLTPTNNGVESHMLSFSEYMGGMSSSYISATCEDPEMALQFLDYGFTPEGMDMVAFGIEGETFTRDDNGNVHYTDMIAKHPEGVRNAEWGFLVNSWMPTRQQSASVYMKYESEKAIEACEMWTAAAKAGDDSMCLPSTLLTALTADELSTVFRYCGDLCTWFAEQTGKYIMGEISEDEFKQAVADADSIGLTEVTEAYQAAYDRYLEEEAA